MHFVGFIIRIVTQDLCTLVLNIEFSCACHESMCESGDIASLILNVSTRWR